MNDDRLDVRWKQRFSNYTKAHKNLSEAVALSQTRALSHLEEQGLIQAFEFTHDLAWKVLKDYLENQGFTNIVGSKGATRLAFQSGLINDGEVWMEMIDSRNLTSHTYNIEVARVISQKIRLSYFEEFTCLLNRFTALQAQ